LRRTEREAILDLVLTDLLTNPKNDHFHTDYGVPGVKQIGLSTDSTVPWPANYVPHVPGFTFVYLDPHREKPPGLPPMLGITLHHFAFPPPQKPPPDDLFSGYHIALGVFSIGGRGAVDSGVCVYYDLTFAGHKWRVKYGGEFHP
jgi:hypothetical protein